MIKVRLVINKSKKDSHGNCPVNLRFSFKGERKEINFRKIKVDPKKWNSKKQEITNNNVLNLRIQNELNRIKTEINKLYILDENIELTEIFEKVIRNPKKTSNKAFLLTKIINDSFINNTSLAYATRKAYRTLQNNIQNFKANSTINEVDIDYVHKFTEFLKNKYSVSPGSLWTRVKNLKRVVRFCYQSKLIDKYSLDGLKVSKSHSKRNFLNIDQIKTLKSYTPTSDLKNTYNAFMFSIFTGLRISDLITITQKNITITSIGGISEYRLNLTMRKTKSNLNQTLSDSALKYIRTKSNSPNEPVFSFLTEDHLNLPQDTLSRIIESKTAIANKNLKKILEFVGIDGNYSFHCARHTFATTALYFGADLVTLRDLVGHKDVRATQIYLNVVDSKKREAVLKFDEI